ncbi:MAG: hypothetical protein K8S55_00265, partial [Phycisphaerae bacterium]|nr:hypothetical protein [Phycisphaerae bacterium]
GMLDAIVQVLLVVTMRLGHRGMTWSIAQSAMVISFLAAILIWGEHPGLWGWVGVTCILAAVILIGSNKSEAEKSVENNQRSSRSWLLLAILTMLVLGASQTLMGVPSRWANWSNAAGLRMPIALTGTAVMHAFIMLVNRRKLTRRVIPYSAAWAVLTFLAFLGLFFCLDRMAESNRAGIAYPIGIGTNIFAFSVYSYLRLSETYTKTRIAGLCLIVMGIVVMGVCMCK